MRRHSRHRRSKRIFNKLIVVVVCFALALSTTPLVAADSVLARANWLFSTSQDQRNGPRPGAPDGVFPNMDEMRLLTDDARRHGARIPTIPQPIPSTRRRWRHEVSPPGTVSQPLRKPEAEFRELLAYSLDRSTMGDFSQSEQPPGPISDSPFNLFSTLESSYPRALTPPPDQSAFAMARLAPQNRTGTPGVDLLSGNFNWNLGLIGLRGRSGLDLGLGLAYNSKVWTRSGNSIDFDVDKGTPAPGFRLGFPVVQGFYYNDQAGAYFYLLITPSGQHVELRRIGTTSVYQTVDATYAQLTDYGSYLVYRADGAQLTLVPSVPSSGEYHCTEVKDRNGNYLTISYNGGGDISTVTDTLARVINFNYDANANLTSLTQTWGGQTRSWATFGYGLRNVGHNFPTLTSYGPDNVYFTVLTQVGLADGSRYNFEYNNYYGMVSEIRHHAPDGHERRRTTYIFDGSTTDCPRVSAQREWAENWNGDVEGNHASAEEAVTQFGIASDGAPRMVLPNGVIYKEYYGTGWQAGLVTATKIHANVTDETADISKKRTTTAWTQDNTGVSYLLNPRITETNVRDDSNNLRRTTIDYGPYQQYSLPYLVREYAANGTTPIRETYTDYNLGQAYLDRRIIGLVAWVHVSDTGQWLTKITYGYDDPTKLEGLPSAPTRHDSSFNTSYLARGNVTSVSRWDVNDINNSAKALTTQISYNITGSLIRTTDPATHSQTIVYSDWFSDGLNGRQTFAYPTTATDADGFSSYVQYNFDFGAVTRTQGPPPAGQSQGAITTLTYDAAGRIQWVNNVNNGAWKYTTYADRGDAVMSQVTINAEPPSYWSITVVDGADRVRLQGGDHPGSGGGPYSGAFTLYDVMGRVSLQSNPAETNAYWSPTGDDIAGWVWTQQTYDWQGRPLVTTNPDGTTKEASYGGCGCAGGAVVTLTDEGTSAGGPKRQQKIYSDVLGRTVKTEVMNWNGVSVYSATVNSYNARDQITQVREYAGAAGSAPYQDTAMNYDGYGRLKTRHVPKQQIDPLNSASTDHTTWDYNADDTVQKITDARGAISTFGYNNRHLVTSKTYTVLPGVPTTGPSAVTPVAAASFAYDAAGNRTSMTDGLGSKTYQYDQLSRLTSETRTISGVGTYPLSYSYNLSGALTSITNSSGGQVGYNYDSSGRVTAVTGSNFANISSFASNIKYRAWGALKQLDYGNTRTLSMSYNSRLQPASFTVPGVMSKTYDYYADGKLKFSHDLIDAKFDRSYSYDHAGRITEALSGAEARNEGTTNLRPYKETFVYDALGHLVERPISLVWSGQGGTFNPWHQTYQNERNTGWGYDAEGNLTDSGYVDYTIDAAGQAIRVVSLTFIPYNGNPYSTIGSITNDQGRNLDGDGAVLKLVNAETTHDSTNGDQTTTATTYLVRSTVLGGRVVTEIDSETGQREFVYLGSVVLASKLGNGTVKWEHRDPHNASSRMTWNTGAIYNAEKAEVDPLSTNAGTADPTTVPSLKKLSLYPGWGEAAMAGDTQCNVDGILQPCDRQLMHAISAGALRVESIFGSAWGFEAVRVNDPDTYGPDKTDPKNPHPNATVTIYANYHYELVYTGVTTTSINLHQPQNPDRAGIKNLVDEALAKDPCAQFAERILAAVSSRTNPALKGGDLFSVFALFLNKGGQYTRTLPPGSAGWGNPIGLIPNGAKIAMQYFPDPALQTWSDAVTTIGELFHLAGSKAQYGDYELAKAVHDIPEYAAQMSLRPESNIFDPRYTGGDTNNKDNGGYSSYFHNVERTLCAAAKP